MADFGPLGGVKITGFISPVDTADEFAVIDPLYGIDGFRNLTGGTSDLDNIPVLRRRAGMFVGVSGGTAYYKLKDITWNFDFDDWEEVTFGEANGHPLVYSGDTNVIPDFGNSLINSGVTSSSILGGSVNIIDSGSLHSVIGGGSGNTVNGVYGVVGGGLGNTAGYFSIVGGGYANIAFSGSSAVLGGDYNQIIGASRHSGIVGGDRNQINNSVESFIGGGDRNVISGTSTESGILGGSVNIIGGSIQSGIGGGYGNVIDGANGSVIAGGYGNNISEYYSFIGGGYFNEIRNGFGVATIVGGDNNVIDSSNRGTIVGGSINVIDNSQLGTIVGGRWHDMTNSSNYGFIGGGQNNNMDSSGFGIIVGGKDNNITGSTRGFIGSGDDNIILNSPYSSIIGGFNNHTNGFDEVHIIGSNITATTANTTFVENVNIVRDPIIDNTLTDLLVRDTDGSVRIRQATSISGATGTTGSLTAKFAVTTAFTEDVTLTINHGMSLAGGDEYDIIVQLRDTVGGDAVGASIDNFTSNTVDITFSQTYSAIRVVIIG